MECRPVSEPSLDVSLTSSQRVWCLSAPIRGRRFQAGSLVLGGNYRSPFRRISTSHPGMGSFTVSTQSGGYSPDVAMAKSVHVQITEDPTTATPLPLPPWRVWRVEVDRSRSPESHSGAVKDGGLAVCVSEHWQRFEQHDNQQAAVTPWALSLPGVSGIRRGMIQSVRSGHKTQLAACSMPDARCRP